MSTPEQKEYERRLTLSYGMAAASAALVWIFGGPMWAIMMTFWQSLFVWRAASHIMAKLEAK